MILRIVHWFESSFSLGVKISALIIFTILATSTSLSYLIYTKGYNAMEWELKSTGIRLASDLAKRSAPILMTGDTWEYRPAEHKTQHHHEEKVIPLGPRSQSIIRPFLRPDTEGYLFSPAEAEAE